MGLLNRQKHKLVDLVASVYLDYNDIRIALQYINISPAKIILNGSASSNWGNVIEYIKDRDEFSKLLEYLKADLKARDSEKLPDLEMLSTEIYRHSPEHLLTLLKEIIPKGECVLFLGPQAFKFRYNNSVKDFNSCLADKMTERLDGLNIFFESSQQNNLGYLIDRYESREKASIADTKKFAADRYDEFIQNDYHNLVYERLAARNFKLVINTNPDLLFAANNTDYIRLRYDQTNNANPVLLESDLSKSMVFNIYGSFDVPMSVLFTENDAVKFTKGIYESSPPILRHVKNMIEQRYGLFIGFNYKEWPLKILFDVLDLKNKPGNFSINEENVEDQDLEYYAKQYNMTFITDNYDQFLNNL